MMTTIRNFLPDKSGSFTVVAVFMLMAMLVVGSVAIDFMRRTEAQVDLQIAADTAAHAALVKRQKMDADAAKAVAVQLANKNSDTYAKDAAIAATDITFGVWDPETRVFTPDPDSKSAVQVQARRDTARDNIVHGILTRLVGVKGFEIAAQSTFSAVVTSCARNGVVAENTVSFTSSNYFAPGYCIHSDNAVEFQQSNFFDTEVAVTLPDLANLTVPGGNLGGNPGLAEALKEMPARLDANELVALYRQGVIAGDLAFSPIPGSYSLESWNFVSSNAAGNLTTADLPEGETHIFVCWSGSTTIKFETGTYRNIVVLTNCRVGFGPQTAFEGVAILSTNTSPMSVQTPAGVRFGAIDNCAEGGGAVVVTYGGMKFAADLELHEGLLLAKGNIAAAAKPDGVHGAVIIAGGSVNITSSGGFGFCNTNFQLAMRDFKMVN